MTVPAETRPSHGWRHRMHAEASAVEQVPPVVAPVEAQPWCNFVLWTPKRLPADCELATGTLRREGPPGAPRQQLDQRGPWEGNNLASYRFEVGGGGRRLRIKEFLYDWAFPALDHPSLWKAHTRALALDDRYVLWLGLDYLGKPGASARLARTMIELSVLEGEFSEPELLDLVRALRPADAAAVPAIASTPLAELSYWARRQDAVQLVVPVGPWQYRRGAHIGDWISGEPARALTRDWAVPASLGGMELDSAARIHDAKGRRELEVVYAEEPDRGRELRLIAQEPGAGNLRVPAGEEPHPCRRELTRIAGADVQLAWIDERYGPFQAVFATQDGALEATLLSSTGVGLDRTWFSAALATVIDHHAAEAASA